MKLKDIIDKYNLKGIAASARFKDSSDLFRQVSVGSIKAVNAIIDNAVDKKKIKGRTMLEFFW